MTTTEWNIERPVDEYGTERGVADFSPSELASQDAILKLVELFNQQLFLEHNDFVCEILELISSWPHDFDRPLLGTCGVAPEPGDEPRVYTGPRLVAAIKRPQNNKFQVSTAVEGLKFKQAQSRIDISFDPHPVHRTTKRDDLLTPE